MRDCMKLQMVFFSSSFFWFDHQYASSPPARPPPSFPELKKVFSWHAEYFLHYPMIGDISPKKSSVFYAFRSLVNLCKIYEKTFLLIFKMKYYLSSTVVGEVIKVENSAKNVIFFSSLLPRNLGHEWILGRLCRYRRGKIFISFDSLIIFKSIIKNW